MLTATPQKGTAKKVRFPGIVADAKALGVNRITLYRVLTGEFTHLKGLKRRYLELKEKEGKATA